MTKAECRGQLAAEEEETNLEPVILDPSRRRKSQRRILLGKTAIASSLVIGTNVLGNYALRRGLNQVGVLQSWSPVPYIQAFAHPWVGLGVIFMFAWLCSRLSLLSWADLTYVLPVTSFTYVLSALIGAIYLNEQISRLHWVGICVMTLGVILVVLTYPKTGIQNEDNR